MPLFDEVIATRLIQPRALDMASVIAEHNWQKLAARPDEDISSALSPAMTMVKENDVTCVTVHRLLLPNPLKRHGTQCHNRRCEKE